MVASVSDGVAGPFCGDHEEVGHLLVEDEEGWDD